MVHIPALTFKMGSNEHYLEERPEHEVSVGAFWIDTQPVTNARFKRFVDATGYVTFCEKPPDPKMYPGAKPEMLYAGSLVFCKPPWKVPLRDPAQWWKFVKGANWKHPHGPESDIKGKEDHPVVHIAYVDAEEFAKWERKSLPTEAEWEGACRGGLNGSEFAWGDELTPKGAQMANIWQGEFPWHSLKPGGMESTTPVGSFAPNAYGLYDMVGNVWEWTSDWYQGRHVIASNICCSPRNPSGGEEDASFDPNMPQIRIPRKVLKGGSYLCSYNYCRRYRPAARFPEPIDTSTCHLGFRCVVRPR